MKERLRNALFVAAFAAALTVFSAAVGVELTVRDYKRKRAKRHWNACGLVGEPGHDDGCELCRVYCCSVCKRLWPWDQGGVMDPRCAYCVFARVV